jgi:hypothetical protein
MTINQKKHQVKVEELANSKLEHMVGSGII